MSTYPDYETLYITEKDKFYKKFSDRIIDNILQIEADSNE